jgi:hypothetical protein
MTIFRVLLVLILTALVSYTGIVIVNNGMDLFPIFFGDMLKMGWPGQFNLDFMFMLTLSALWTAWRNRFSTIGIVLACLALFGGSLFLSTYLLVLSWQANGDMKQVLLGDARTDE